MAQTITHPFISLAAGLLWRSLNQYKSKNQLLDSKPRTINTMPISITLHWLSYCYRIILKVLLHGLIIGYKVKHIQKSDYLAAVPYSRCSIWLQFVVKFTYSRTHTHTHTYSDFWFSRIYKLLEMPVIINSSVIL